METPTIDTLLIQNAALISDIAFRHAEIAQLRCRVAELESQVVVASGGIAISFGSAIGMKIKKSHAINS